jgi:tetratricopeptide (TPR) repeat protein
VGGLEQMQSEQDKIRIIAFEKLAEGNVKEAFSFISKIISTNSYTLDDLYLAGQWSLDSGFYEKAIELLTRSLSESTLVNETWYMGSAYIARAYARVLIGENELALEDLAQINDDVELSWLLNHPPVSKLSLLAQIKKK